MINPAPPDDEAQRIQTLRALGVLDSEPVEELDRITRLAARHFQVPIALVTLVDAERLWFISRVGTQARQTARDVSFCAHAIRNRPGVPMVVADTRRDRRFADNPLVCEAPHLRFYAGVPVYSRSGHALGTLCLIDRQPRQFGPDDADSLRDLGSMVEQYFHLIEERRDAERTRRSLATTETLFERTVNQAAVGLALLSVEGRWWHVNDRLCAMLGRDRATLLEATFEQLTHPDDVAHNVALFKQLLAGEIETYALEKRFIGAAGQPIWVQVVTSVMRDEDGKPLYCISAASDIDQRKRTEHELAALRADLERRVAQRTGELSAAVRELNAEIERRKIFQRELTQEQERFRGTLENAIDAFVETDEHGTVTTWNAAAEQIFGWPRADAIGVSLIEKVVPPALRQGYRSALARFASSGEPTLLGQRIEAIGLRRDGAVFPVEVTLGANRVGGRLRINAFLRDISERKASEASIRESRAQLKTVLDNVPAMIAYVGPDLRYRFHNRVFEQWFDLPPDGLDGIHVRDLWGAGLFEQLQPDVQRVLRGEHVSVEYEMRARWGPIWIHSSFVPDIDAEARVAGFYVLGQNVSERKQLQRQLEFEAHHDALTGLPNRRAFMAMLKEAMARTRRQQNHMALLFMDLDGFKQLNDARGHEFGDQVLQWFAATLHASIRETDRVARLAGDEFIVILEHLKNGLCDAKSVACKLREKISAAHVIGGVPIRLSTSIGVALYYVDSGESASRLLARADAAMYQAKAAGRNQIVLWAPDDPPAEPGGLASQACG
ncbi:MAG: PAS domain S-box protein [Burkholderiales bacterium]|nr:PAS domain S-box protein [Burkholderiales bacterium]